MKLSSFEEFMNESLVRYFPRRVPSFVVELFENLLLKMKNTDHEFAGTFENGDCWWCAKDEESFYNTFSKVGSIPNLLAAEKRETEERSKKPDEKDLSQFYIFEIKTVIGRAFSFSLCGIDMQNKEVFCQIDSFKSIINSTFEDLMKKYYPGTAVAKKYGL